MKSNKNFRNSATDGLEAADLVRRASKLEPNKKSGKQNHAMYKELEYSDEDEDELLNYKKKESTFDYFDDGSDDEDEFVDEEYDEDEDEEYDDDEDDEEEEEEIL